MYKLGIDVGGTNTDAVLIDGNRRVVAEVKHPTTGDIYDGIVGAVREVLARYPGVTHLRCRLETGRTHQIRVHLAYIGHPILGDTVYGNKKPVPGLTGQCLHATGLRFLHPRTGRPVELTCPRPEEFERMLTKLQKRT